MYQGLKSLGLSKKFENYMLEDKRNLSQWLKENRIDKSKYMQWHKYILDGGDAVFENKSKKRDNDIC